LLQYHIFEGHVLKNTWLIYISRHQLFLCRIIGWKNLLVEFITAIWWQNYNPDE